MKTLNLYLLFISLFVAQTANAFPQHQPVPGGIAIIPLSSSVQPNIHYNERKVLTVFKDNQWLAIVGISLSENERKSQVLNLFA